LKPNPLSREEYVEQAYMYKAMSERVQSEPLQELLVQIREEVLATTKLPMAIDYLLAEIRHVGTMATAMTKMHHYFVPYQTFLVKQAVEDHGQFDMCTAFQLLHFDAKFRSENAESPAMFFFQFEALCRHRLDYDFGLTAMSADPLFDDEWSHWILKVRHQLGILEIADLVYVHSEHYLKKNDIRDEKDRPKPLLFSEQEGRIALANRKKEPHYLFLALQRQMGYPKIPQKKQVDPLTEIVPKLQRTLERMEVRMKLLEEEQRSKGIDITQFYGREGVPPPSFDE
jgi:hypothetical protein